MEGGALMRFEAFAALCMLLMGGSCLLAEVPQPIRVSADGAGGAFTSVQSAVDSITDRSTDPRIILIQPGVYRQRINVPQGKAHITFKGAGDDASKVLLTYDLHAGMDDPQSPGKKVGTSGSESVLISADDFTADGVTFQNSAGEVGQAVALRITGDRERFRNCRFLGWQDTLYANGGRSYFDHCYIEGRTDFIFGRATAVFDHCEIYSKNGGFVTAASTLQERPFGFVFLDCQLTGEGAQAYLGRPWRPYSAVAFIRCQIGGHIRPEGWSTWNGNENHKTARYSEFDNTGPGATTDKRVPWSRQLTGAEAAKYTTKNILAGADNWNPADSDK
jgi:pectinesterase